SRPAARALFPPEPHLTPSCPRQLPQPAHPSHPPQPAPCASPAPTHPYDPRAAASQNPGLLFFYEVDTRRFPRQSARARCPPATPARSASQNRLLRLSCSCFVPVNFPTEVFRRRFVHRACHRGKIRRHVMFESVLADVPQQPLQLRNLHHSRSAKRLERIVRKLAFTHIPTNLPGQIVRRKSRET